MVSRERRRRRGQNTLKANEERRRQLELESKSRPSSFAASSAIAAKDDRSKKDNEGPMNNSKQPSTTSSAPAIPSGWLSSRKDGVSGLSETASTSGKTPATTTTASTKPINNKTKRNDSSSSDSDSDKDKRAEAQPKAGFEFESPPSKRLDTLGGTKQSVPNFSAEHPSASPQSSVTFSQDPTRAVPLKSLHEQDHQNENEEDIADDDEEESFSPIVAAQKPPTRKRKIQRSSSSSSSDDSLEELVALAAMKEQSESQTKQLGDGGNNNDPASLKKQGDGAACNETHDDVDSSDDNEDSQELRTNGQARRNKQQSSEIESVDSDSDDSQRNKARSSSNPMSRLKEVFLSQSQESLTLKDTSPSPVAGAQRSTSLDDLLWNDDVEMDDVASANAKKQTKRQCKKPPKVGTDAIDSDDGSRNENEKKQTKKAPKRKKQKVSSKKASTASSFSAADGYESELGDLEESRDVMKPEFPHPQFGPFDLKPMVLGKAAAPGGGEAEEYTVPASISQYLPWYQKDGTEFAFRTIIERGGAILGDDMGLGKTIQTAALLAALLQKSGTGQDLIDICERKREVEQLEREKQKAAEMALERGEAYIEPTTKASHILRSAWAPILILSPKSVINNWVTDLGTWGHFSLTTYGDHDSYAGLDKIVEGKADILISSHTVLQYDKHVVQLSEVPWKLVVVDEFHMFKNEKGIKTENIREIRDRHGCRILGLTGTLMQNNHKELWSLVDVVSPELLGSWKEFETSIATPIKLSRAKDASFDAVEAGERKQKELMALLDTVYLRRTKEEVLKDLLPEKNVKIVFCEPSPLQKAIYQHCLKQPEFECLAKAFSPCDCGVNDDHMKCLAQLQTQKEKLEYHKQNKGKIIRRSKCCYQLPATSRGGDEIDQRAVFWLRQHEGEAACKNCPFCLMFPCMSLLNKLSTHVSLILPENLPESLTGKKRSEAQKALEAAEVYIPKTVVADLPGGELIRQDSVMNDHFNLSGKMKALAPLLKKLEMKEERVLLFSYSTTSLDLVEAYIVSTGYKHLRMDGGTYPKKRIELAERFRREKDIFIFLLSTKAMGLGLNLTSASTVVIFDVEWNPSYDEQAQDRSYRIGQSKDVTVYRLVSRGTIEELRYLRQVYKQQLQAETFFDEKKDQKKDQKRVFMGVAGDTSRRGELFGVSNLLRFDPKHTFMKYGGDTKEATEFGDDCVIYDMETFSNAAKGLSEKIENEEDICSLFDLEKQSGSRDRALSRNSTSQSQSPTFVDLFMSNEKRSPSASPQNSVGAKPVAAQEVGNGEVMDRKRNSSSGSPVLASKKMTATGKKHKATTFSANDLALPGGARKKKKKKSA